MISVTLSRGPLAPGHTHTADRRLTSDPTVPSPRPQPQRGLMMDVAGLLIADRSSRFRNRHRQPVLKSPTNPRRHSKDDDITRAGREWFSSRHVVDDLDRFGIKFSASEWVDFSKATMLAKMAALLNGPELVETTGVKEALPNGNHLGQGPRAGRRLAFANLRSLCCISNPRPLSWSWFRCGTEQRPAKNFWYRSPPWFLNPSFDNRPNRLSNARSAHGCMPLDSR